MSERWNQMIVPPPDFLSNTTIIPYNDKMTPIPSKQYRGRIQIVENVSTKIYKEIVSFLDMMGDDIIKPTLDMMKKGTPIIGLIRDNRSLSSGFTRREERRVIGTILAFRHRLIHNNVAMSIAYITGLCVDRSYRGTGMAMDLIKSMGRYIEKHNMPIAYYLSKHRRHSMSVKMMCWFRPLNIIECNKHGIKYLRSKDIPSFPSLRPDKLYAIPSKTSCISHIVTNKDNEYIMELCQHLNTTYQYYIDPFISVGNNYVITNNSNLIGYYTMVERSGVVMVSFFYVLEEKNEKEVARQLLIDASKMGYILYGYGQYMSIDAMRTIRVNEVTSYYLELYNMYVPDLFSTMALTLY